MVKVAIAGGTGYGAGELIRLLINHPNVELVAIFSSSLAGQPVAATHRDLTGDIDLHFSAPEEFSFNEENIDLLFLALGHGLSAHYLEGLNLHTNCKIIDLANDFRLGEPFGERHFIYGLPEINREKIRGGSNIANPGCFATAILIGLLPILEYQKVKGDIHLHGITGSTGAGKSLSESAHFSYRASNVSVYKPFTHQHLAEISMVLSQSRGGIEIPKINFVPMRGDFTRGIFCSIYMELEEEWSIDEVEEQFKEFYSASPFVKISPYPISLKEVVNTNKGLIRVERHGELLHVTTATDNLIKGASGQAIQNMNLMFGFDEWRGLQLKGSAF